MTLKRLLPLLRGLLGFDPSLDRFTTARIEAGAGPVQQEKSGGIMVVQIQEIGKLRGIYRAKKVLFLAKSGRKLMARVEGTDQGGRIILRRAGHPLAPTFVRPTSEVFLR